MSLSDLELVSQAMAGSEPAGARGNASMNTNGAATAATTTSTTTITATTTNGASVNGTAAAEQPAHGNGAAHLPAVANSAAPEGDSVAGIDLSSLSAEERAMLGPIIAALRASDESLDVDDIMSQLDAAGTVADNIEDRLDALLAHLGELEAQAEAAEKR